jgi:alcohol dehydrogenase-like protein
MRAVWYDRQGPAAEVLQAGELPDPQPGPGEVRVRVGFSGVNPGDTKKRRGWLGSSMPYPRVIPHSDATGVVDAVGEGVASSRIGRRVWVYGAQSYPAFGTAAEHTVVPESLAVDLPDEVSDEVGACLGIPGITAHRAVFGDGPVIGATVLVHGGCSTGSAPSPPNSHPGAGRPSSARSGAARIWVRCPTGRWRTPSPSANPTPPPSATSCRAASTGSSRSPSPTTSTSTPPWPGSAPSSPPTRPATTGPVCPSGRCSSTT